MTSARPGIEDQREQIAVACRILAHLGVSYASYGHVSYRAPGSDLIQIRGKGEAEVGLRFTAADDVIDVDFAARKVGGREGLQPPSEVFIHLGLYQRRPEITSVIHVHPEYAVLLTIAGRSIMPIIGAYGGGRIAARGVPVYPRSVTVSNAVLGDEFAEFMGGQDIAMMQGHGATVVGDSVEDATVRAIVFNDVARLNYRAHLLGDPTLIAADEREAMARPKAAQRSRGSAGGRSGVLASWEYYRTLEARNM